MSQIFSNSLGNLIYLGEPDGSEDQALRSIRALCDVARAQTRGFDTFRKTLINDWGASQYSDSGIEIPVNVTALQAFYSKPWFERLWVVQEASLAPTNTCYCGPHECILEEVLVAGAWLDFKRIRLPKDLADAPGVLTSMFILTSVDQREQFIRPRTQFVTGMASILNFQRNLKTTDDRDRVYGLLGISEYYTRDLMPPEILPDYTKRGVDVLREATRIAMRESEGDLDMIFRYVSHISERDLVEWPSWVPKWSRPFDQENEPQELAHIFNANKEAKRKHTNVDHTLELDAIELVGFRIGTIVDATNVLSPQDAARASRTKEWINGAEALARRTLPTDETSVVATALGYTIVGGSNAEENEACDEDVEQLRSFRRFVQRNRLPPSPKDVTSLTSKDTVAASRFWQAFWDASRNRRFFTTAEGRIGLGPKILAPGDIVVIIYGCCTPYVLRPIGSRYKMLGQCYVYGAMFGEELEKHTAQGNDDVAFAIC